MFLCSFAEHKQVVNENLHKLEISTDISRRLPEDTKCVCQSHMQHFPFDGSALATQLHVAPLLVCDVDCLVVDSSDVGLSVRKTERKLTYFRLLEHS